MDGPARAARAARPRAATAARVVAARLGAAAAVAALLVAAVTGGLLRAGVVPPLVAGAGWLAPAVTHHAALMICGFLGTMIALERAVALHAKAAFLVPAASALGGWMLLRGQPAAGAWLLVAASAGFVAVNIVIVRRQCADHTIALGLGAAAWLTGNLVFALGIGRAAPLPWWFAFLVVTIAAERLEMSRLLERGPAAQPLFYAILMVMGIGAVRFAAQPAEGGLVFGIALAALSAWLFAHDIARRTVRAPGLPRYIAVCMLCGHAWLAVAGAAWIAMAFGAAARDVALHALGLGFVFGMVMGHAPVIVPALARVRLRFRPVFYLPVALLHLSLAVRLWAGAADPAWRALGAAGNGLAIALFALVVAASSLEQALRWLKGSRSTKA
jgi:hypothetical protein